MLQAMSVILLRINCIFTYNFTRVFRSWQKTVMKDESMPSRSDPIVKKLDNPLFHSIFTPELNVLSQLFKKYDYELKLVGGAVRDILMDIKPADLDFATNATPSEMKDMFNKENIRMLNSNGEKHGTITARINDKENFEVTTLRIDTVTNGRHAKVEFTKDWKKDALRRDLTINSMFLDLEGKVYDYYFGYDDLLKKRVIFVGDPENRIQEDYLRILRYFRFCGKIANQPDSYDEETIMAIKKHISGIQMISGERIWNEWHRILSGNYAKELTLKMLECGIAKYIGLPENLNIKNFEVVYDACKKQNVSLQPVSLITLLLKDEDEVLELHKRLKFSIFERDLAFFLLRSWEEKPLLSADLLKFYIRKLIHWKGNCTYRKIYVCELLKCKQHFSLAEEIENFKIPRFPINGSMLQSEVKTKIIIGIVLRELKDIWLDKNFNISKEELLKEVPRIICELEDKN